MLGKQLHLHHASISHSRSGTVRGVGKQKINSRSGAMSNGAMGGAGKRSSVVKLQAASRSSQVPSAHSTDTQPRPVAASL